MSHFLDRLTFFKRQVGTFSNGHGIVTDEPRDWEDGYRKRWQHDKIVRSTHGVNCTGSCSWKIYVKGGIVTWETQQTDYPRTRPDLPNHEPRGCARGASYSWYLYSANRVKHPMVRGRLLQLWREARATLSPVAAWASIVESPEKRASYTSKRGLGGLVRATWDEVNEIIAAANAYTVKKYGPDRVIGFSPIPAMSMVSYRRRRALPVAARRRLPVLLRLVLRPAARQPDDLGRADGRSGKCRLVQCRLSADLGFERAADPHARRAFLYRGPLQGHQERRHLARTMPRRPSSPISGCIPSRAPTRRWRWRWAMSSCANSTSNRTVPYFQDYIRKYTDLPMLVRLVRKDGSYVPDRLVRADDFADGLGEANNPAWKTVALDADGQPGRPARLGRLPLGRTG